MTDNSSTLILIDGHALAYRMYHALINADFSTTDGEPTGATFGFTRTVLDIILGDDPPDYIAVSFDVGRTFRDDLYEEYKATREDIPEDLQLQVDRIHEVLEAFNIPILEFEGYEADDVLGTLSKQASERQVDTLIITSDSDLLQLVDDYVKVQLHAPFSGPTVYDVDAVVERYGVDPLRLIDYKALVGDSSDNIPGVRGVGKKTAAKLLAQYHDLDEILANLEDISSTRARNALSAGVEDAKLSYKLVTIVRDIPVELDLEACRTRDFDITAVLDIFKELQFSSLIKRLAKADDPKEEGEQLSLFGMSDDVPSIPDGYDLGMGSYKPDTKTIIIQDEDALDALVERLNKSQLIAFDTETTSVNQMQAELVGISLAFVEGEAYYIPVAHEQGEQLPMELVLAKLKPAFTNPDIEKAAHNIKYDAIVLQRHGLMVYPLSYDTMIAEWLIDPNAKVGLKPTANRYFGIEMTEITELLGSGRKQKTMDQVAIAEAAPYAAADADYTLRLVSLTQERLKERGVWDLFVDVEMPLVPVLANMEHRGILLDTDYLAQMSTQLNSELENLQQELYRIAGREFNLNSPPQLSEVLFDVLMLPTDGVRKTKSGYYSTAAHILESLLEVDETGIIVAILQYRSLEKLRGTYVDALPGMVNAGTGRIHSSFNQTGTVTGRLSSSDPNLQNIPIRTEIGRRVRHAFIASPGHVLIAADYSQIELRVLAHMSGDEMLREAFLSGQDIHATTAAAVYGVGLDEVTIPQRSFAKSVNFGLLYGMGAFRLARDSDMSRDEAQTFIDTYFERFPSVRGYLDTTKEQAIEEGYVQTLLGRKRYFEVFQSERGGWRQRRAAEREAINMPVQGTAADVMKIAMINLERALREGGFGARILLQVHDELVLEAPEEEAEQAYDLVQHTMQEAYPLDVPLQVEAQIGQNWGELK
jgi:DNA polymerase-1